MARKKRRLRRGVYDCIIYSCLFGAILILFIVSASYIKSLKNESLSTIAKQVFLESPTIDDSPNEPPETELVPEKEPSTVSEIDKSSLVINYIESIKDRIIIDDVIPYETALSWHTYFVSGLTFEREITSDYYLYKVDLSLNKEALLPVSLNESLTTPEYNVISLNVYILKKNDTYIIKNIDPCE